MISPLVQTIIAEFSKASSQVADTLNQAAQTNRGYFTGDPRDPYIFAAAITLVAGIGIACQLYNRHMDRKTR
jgi:hypothetical protein